MSSTQISTLVVCTLVFLIVFFAVQILIQRQRRRDQQSIQGIEWQLNKMQRFANGWQPTLWDPNDPTVTSEEKAAALLAYAEGKPIPLSGIEARQQQMTQQVKRGR